MANAVLYNSMAWVITGSNNYSANAANYVKTWFVDPDTAMTPNLNYAQLPRGPNGQTGAHTGVLLVASIDTLWNMIIDLIFV